MKRTSKVAYVIALENPASDLLRRQVIELVADIRKATPTTRISIFLFFTLQSVLFRRCDLRMTRVRLEASGAGLHVIPTLCPWPLPFPRLRRTAAGWHPLVIWDRWSVRSFKLAALPVLLALRLFGGYRIFHCRSWPATSAAILVRRLVPGTSVLFDPRSDFPEENVTAGNWPLDSRDFRYWKGEERRLLERSAAVACIAPSYARAFRSAVPACRAFLAPNNVRCSDFRRNGSARAHIRRTLRIPGQEPVFLYLGDLGTSPWHQPEFYRAFYDMLVSRGASFRFLFLTPERNMPLVREKFAGCDRVVIASPPYNAIAEYLSAADYGMMFLHRAKNVLGTKIVEYLSASLPILVNRNCLAAVELIEEEPRIGCVVNLGLGDLDTIHAFGPEAMQSIRALLHTGLSLYDFARDRYDNSAVAARYAEQYVSMERAGSESSAR